jgi:hypothetical protein
VEDRQRETLRSGDPGLAFHCDVAALR